MTYTETLNYLDHMKRDLEVDLQQLKQYNQLWDYAKFVQTLDIYVSH